MAVRQVRYRLVRDRFLFLNFLLGLHHRLCARRWLLASMYRACVCPAIPPRRMNTEKLGCRKKKPKWMPTLSAYRGHHQRMRYDFWDMRFPPHVGRPRFQFLRRVHLPCFLHRDRPPRSGRPSGFRPAAGLHHVRPPGRHHWPPAAPRTRHRRNYGRQSVIKTLQVLSSEITFAPSWMALAVAPDTRLRRLNDILT